MEVVDEILGVTWEYRGLKQPKRLVDRLSEVGCGRVCLGSRFCQDRPHPLPILPRHYPVRLTPRSHAL